ncbi:MAG TPA: tRNA (adenosine(37)-N6)-threonylcarbamoyltransferase complex dimerization subunit type 1 TsaB [Vicinamibacterales bacterium]|jgi:tRNA threonylcarbamoyladenosine biosynthesis protein TsaB
MRVLALDTTARAGSVALVIDDGAPRIVDERAGDASRTHGERLPGELIAILKTHDLSVADADLFAVASGPGSFTGLRIGIATMQGLAVVRRRPLAGVSALAALGHLGSRSLEPGARVGAWIDAQRGEVFAALYEIAAHEVFDTRRLVEIDAATASSPAETIARWRSLGLPALILGDGAERYETIVRTSGARVESTPRLAGAIGALAAAESREGRSPSPAAIRPLYVRRPDAELAREHALADRTADVSRSD